MSLSTRVLAEFIGTAFLLIVVVGSGVMGQNLAGGNSALALLANSIATGAGLYVLINCLADISGAHFNPAVTLAQYFQKNLNLRTTVVYIVAQILGAIVGVWTTHFMFGLEILQISNTDRAKGHLYFSELIATLGLLLVIRFSKASTVAASVALYITGAYWFTSSTSFANPAVTIARSLTDTFAGIAPSGVAGFIAAQFLACGILSARPHCPFFRASVSKEI